MNASLDLTSHTGQLINQEPLQRNGYTKVGKRKGSQGDTQNSRNRIRKFSVAPRRKIDSRLTKVWLLTCEVLVNIKAKNEIPSNFMGGFGNKN